MQTVVNLTKIVTPNAMRQCLCFLYTGQIDPRFCSLQVSLHHILNQLNWFWPRFTLSRSGFIELINTFSVLVPH